MRLTGNILWLIFGGLLLSILYALVGIIMFILIITIPFGIQAFKLASFTLWPFGRTLVRRPDAGTGSLLGNAIWFVLAGWWLALGHVVHGIALTLTIIGIPLALGHFKLAVVALWPFGADIVPVGAYGERIAGGVLVRRPGGE